MVRSRTAAATGAVCRNDRERRATSRDDEVRGPPRARADPPAAARRRSRPAPAGGRRRGRAHRSGWTGQGADELVADEDARSGRDGAPSRSARTAPANGAGTCWLPGGRPADGSGSTEGSTAARLPRRRGRAGGGRMGRWSWGLLGGAHDQGGEPVTLVPAVAWAKLVSSTMTSSGADEGWSRRTASPGCRALSASGPSGSGGGGRRPRAARSELVLEQLGGRARLARSRSETGAGAAARSQVREQAAERHADGHRGLRSSSCRSRSRRP